MKSISAQLSKAIFFSFIPLFFHSQSAMAGFEETCEPDFYLDASKYNKCSNLPVLVPGNDNQTNMLLLLSDLGLATIRFPSPDEKFWTSNYGNAPFEGIPFANNRIANQRAKNINGERGYDERCNTISNGKNHFIQQVNHHKNIPTTEKQILISERNKISECTNNLALIPINSQWSSVTRQYASYLNASIAFYNTNYSTATKIYSVLANIDDAWLKETSQYMMIRTSLNAAFASGTNQYGDLNLDKIDKSLLKEFLDNITLYLKVYPNGQYAASARGFMRRGFWLTGRQDLLVNEIVWQLNNPKSKYYNLEINELPAEIDRRVFNSQYFDLKNLNNPFFLATYNLMQMRDSKANGYTPITWNQLNVQKHSFKKQPELFQYLQAVHLFYVQKKPQEALKYLANTKGLNNSLQFSQAFLKGQILEKSNASQAEQYWSNLVSQSKNTAQRGLFETALSNHMNAKQNINAFIGNKPLITQINLQKRFILYKANEKSLESIVQNSQATTDQKQAALYTLLSKSIQHQNFALFNRYYAQLPKDAAQYKSYDGNKKYEEKPPFSDFIWNGATITPQLKCSNLQALTNQLEKSPQDPLLNICLGEYSRSTLYGFPYQMNGENTQSTFKGNTFARGNVYKNIIKSGRHGEIHAYALYRAIMCYSPSGMNDCNDQDVPKSVRKQWYDQIKQNYPNTIWAKSLKYFW